MQLMVYSLDKQCIRALIYAQEESKSLRVNWVCSAQLLLGISRTMGTDVSAAVVLSGLSPHELRLELARVLKHRRETVADVIPYTATAKTVLAQAGAKAKSRSALPHVTLSDLLLAVIENPNEFLVDAVINSGTHWGTFREQVRKRLQFCKTTGQDSLLSSSPLFEGELSDISHDVLQFARSELNSAGTEELSTEHILLGIFQADSSIRQTLISAGVKLVSLRKKILERRQTRTSSEDFGGVSESENTEVKDICDFASLKAKNDSTPITPRHLMLAILSVDCAAQRALEMDESQITRLVESLVEKESEAPSSAPEPEDFL